MSAFFYQMLLILLTLNRRTKIWSALFLAFSIHLFIHFIISSFSTCQQPRGSWPYSRRNGR